MSVQSCETCGAALGPAELATCFSCGPWQPTNIGERALVILERSPTPLTYWDLTRLMDRGSTRSTAGNSLLVYLSRDSRICWAGKGLYGMFRHGLAPNVRGLGPAAEAHLLAAPTAISQDELHFVLKYLGYRYQYPSLAPALGRQLGSAWRTASESEANRLRRERRLALLLGFERRTPEFHKYYEELEDRVRDALTERSTRLE